MRRRRRSSSSFNSLSAEKETAAAAAAVAVAGDGTTRLEWSPPDLQTYITLLSVISTTANRLTSSRQGSDDAEGRNEEELVESVWSRCAVVAGLLLKDALLLHLNDTAANTGAANSATDTSVGTSAATAEATPPSTKHHHPLLGVLLQAALRTCGGDPKRGLHLWQTQVLPVVGRLLLRVSTAQLTSPAEPSVQAAAKAYHGLVHCFGSAGRPDLALKAVYAMKKALSSSSSSSSTKTPNDAPTATAEAATVAWNVYRSAAAEQEAKRRRKSYDQSLRTCSCPSSSSSSSSPSPSLPPPPPLPAVPPLPPVSVLVAPLLKARFYETQLELECLGGVAFEANRRKGNSVMKTTKDSDDDDNDDGGGLREKLPFTKIRIRY